MEADSESVVTVEMDSSKMVDLVGYVMVLLLRACDVAMRWQIVRRSKLVVWTELGPS
jgi:hypothetical protein